MITVELATRRVAARRAPDDEGRDVRIRRVWPWIAGAVAVWAAVASAHLVLAYADGKAGKHHLDEARRTLARSGLTAEPEDVTASLERARRAFERGRQRSSSPLLLPIELAPVVGRQLRSYSALAGAGGRVAEIALAGTEGVQRALDRPAATGEDRLALVRTLSGLADRAHSELARVMVQRGDGLVAPLAREWATLDGHLREARRQIGDGAALLDTLAATLAGPRRYLLLVANNAEMRAGSGMFLGIGTIEAADGRLHLGPVRPAGELLLPEPGVEPDGDLADRWGWLQPGREWRNLAITPRFDATARLAVRMWERLTGERVDGVLAVDAAFLRGVLAATGPLTAGPDTLTEANVVDYVLHDQYAGMTIDAPQEARRDRLGDIASAAFAAVEAGRASLPTLGQEAARAARGRHLLAWSAHPHEQRAWDAAGISGSLGPRSLAVNVLNRGGNKLDRFLAVEAAIDLRPSGGSTDVVLRVDVTNRTPPGEPPYVAGPHPGSGVGEGDYLGIVAVNVPADASDVRFDHDPPLVAAGPDGPTQVVAAPLLLHRDEHETVTVRFRLPGEDGTLTVHPSARLPPMHWQAGAERWVDDSARSIDW